MKINDETGSMVIEFLLYGVLFQIGILIFALQSFSLQAQQLAADSIARHALRSLLVSGIEPELSADQILRSFQSDRKADVQLDCRPDCDSSGSLITLSVKVGQASAIAAAIR